MHTTLPFTSFVVRRIAAVQWRRLSRLGTWKLVECLSLSPHVLSRSILYDLLASIQAIGLNLVFLYSL